MNVPPNRPAIGSTLAGRFELIEFLGSGAYGTVFKVYDRILKTHCCAKLLNPQASARPENRERFRREILLARRIAHRNCCQIFDLGIDGGVYYILMEFVDGRDVLSILEQKRVIAIRDALSIVYQVCSGLRATHEAKVIHRDIKPQNIMVTRQGIVKIMDYGIAKSPDLRTMTAQGIAVGTPSYMSPEQCQGHPADPRSDIYSLGIVLFYMLAGRQPFRADTIPELIGMHISMPAPLPSSVNPKIPTEVDKLVQRCLTKKPEERFQSAVDVRRAISRIFQSFDSSRSLRETTRARVEAIVPLNGVFLPESGTGLRKPDNSRLLRNVLPGGQKPETSEVTTSAELRIRRLGARPSDPTGTFQRPERESVVDLSESSSRDASAPSPFDDDPTTEPFDLEAGISSAVPDFPVPPRLHKPTATQAPARAESGSQDVGTGRASQRETEDLEEWSGAKDAREPSTRDALEEMTESWETVTSEAAAPSELGTALPYRLALLAFLATMAIIATGLLAAWGLDIINQGTLHAAKRLFQALLRHL